MVDISLIKVSSKFYSVKTQMDVKIIDNEKYVNAKIVSLDLVDPTSDTSFVKLKSVFQSSGNDVLSKLKYPYVYEETAKKLAQKYRMKVLNI